LLSSQPKGFAKNFALSEPVPAETAEASAESGTKAPVNPIESARLESAQRVSTKHSLGQRIETSFVVIRVDLIAMAAAIALLPIGAIFLARTNGIFPRFLEKPSAVTGVSVPLIQTHVPQSVPSLQRRSVPMSQAGIFQKPDRTGIVSDVRYSSDSASALVLVDLDRETQFQVHRISSPERIYLDLQNTKLAPVLFGKAIKTQDRLLRALRVGEHESQTTRITLATAGLCEYSAMWVPNSWQLRIELREAQAPSHESTSEERCALPSSARPSPKPMHYLPVPATHPGDNAGSI
jgi:AMIN domain